MTMLFEAAQSSRDREEIDGPGAIKAIQHSAVHPKWVLGFENAQAMYEGSQLAIHQLELLLLYRCNFQDRVIRRTDGIGVKVYIPWRQITAEV